ncbi:auxin response factor 16 [Jatropha curcas]|uniref:auxin response factor 16 n=1 Tax=Jatropha curcas TaxID=180498 RepID=UPI001895A1A0|nr:auxin response factor 16 [Jatropha curcas]
MIRDFGVMKSHREQLRVVAEKCLDSQLWHACAGGMVQMPSLNSKVFYFPQGHVEHAQGNVDFGHCKIPAMIPCKVSAVKYLADPETDEVFAKIGLIPLSDRDLVFLEADNDDGSFDGNASSQEKPASFAKTLTQSDANNGGGFSVPRYCAETIFPRLDYSAEPPVQTILAKDVHGEIWKFRHIYRGTPRRHLLTTGWSNFVNQKKLVAGDSIVFLRADNGDLCVGIRRAKRGIGGGNECPSGWNSFGGYSGFLREDESKLMRRNGNGNGDMKGKVRAESVIQAATLAANGQPFDAVYYPRASTPEFCVKASAVRAAMQIQWCPGMRFKMAFETEDSSRISWFMGTISSVQVADPIRWPSSPWRLLQVAWDEPDLLQNVKCVSPWLVELVSNMPAIHLSPFSPPRKKLRLPQPPDFPLLGHFPMPSFTSNPLNSNSPLCCVSDNIPAGIQGARHAQYGLSSADLHFNKLQSSPFPVGFQQLDCAAQFSRIPSCKVLGNTENNDDISCLLTMGNPTTASSKENSETKTPHILLFGQLIFTDQQSFQSCSGDTNGNSSSDGNPEKMINLSDGPVSAFHQAIPLENSSDEGSPWYQKTDLSLETGHCKVFRESDDLGRTLDLSVFGSYEELYGKLANMFGVKRSDMFSSVLYRDAAGATKHAGDEPFSEFLKTARRLTILTDSGSDNIET